MQKAPSVRPEERREMASAIWSPIRSCRTITGRMSMAAQNSMRWLTG